MNIRQAYIFKCIYTYVGLFFFSCNTILKDTNDVAIRCRETNNFVIDLPNKKLEIDITINQDSLYLKDNPRVSHFTRGVYARVKDYSGLKIYYMDFCSSAKAANQLNIKSFIPYAYSLEFNQSQLGVIDTVRVHYLNYVRNGRIYVVKGDFAVRGKR